MALRIGVLSDIHLELLGKYPFVLPDSDVLVLAGDIFNDIASSKDVNEFYRKIDEQSYRAIIQVNGNHEFWFMKNKTFMDAFKEKQNNPVEVTVVDDVAFVSLTLWPGLRAYSSIYTTNDVYNIPGFSPEIMFQWHDCEQKELLRIADMMVDAKREGSIRAWVVVSHYSPTSFTKRAEYSHHRFIQSEPMFYVPMDKFIEEYNPDAWIFGHTHSSFDGLYPTGTRLVSNPLGYPKNTPIGHENIDFIPKFCFEV